MSQSKNPAPKSILIETIVAGAATGIVRVHWEKMNAKDINNPIAVGYFNYAIMAAFVAVVVVMGMELNRASWTKRLSTTLLAAFFFKSIIDSGQLEASLLASQHQTEQMIDRVAEVSVQSNSSASHNEAIDAFKNIALDDTESDVGQAKAIDGLAEVTEASDDYEVKLKAIASLVRIGVKAENIEEKEEIVLKLEQMHQYFPSNIAVAISEGIAKIEKTYPKQES